MGVKADEHRESNGTRVESTGDGNVRTRLGVKTGLRDTTEWTTVNPVSSVRSWR
ncbi:autotransporter outer membrane beta-barrel domain-containing protein [Escherichia coli]|nr:autotransporter outer membrane beta-barrel domain-containing protein [Escherichia coli]